MMVINFGRRNGMSYTDWFKKSNSPRIFYSEVLAAKEKRAKKFARKRTTKK